MPQNWKSAKKKERGETHKYGEIKQQATEEWQGPKKESKERWKNT